MRTLDGKVVWITGASSGIGRALALRCASEGATLILSSRREHELRQVAVASRARHAHVIPLDLGRPETMDACAAEAIRLAGHVDVMIHNGGVSQRSLAEESPYTVDEQLVRINYLGPVALTKALLPSMTQRRSGHFVVVSSVLGRFGFVRRSGYCGSKHALCGFFDTLRAEVWKYGIRVTVVVPGYVQTNVSVNAIGPDGTPTGRMDEATARGITPDQCAERIVRAIRKQEREVYAGAFPERAALFFSKLTPGLFARFTRSV